MIGRPKQFKRKEVLDRAMVVFWKQGYEATSIEDLLGSMDINRGSLYDTFGDKHTLFVEAVERYAQTVVQKYYSALDLPGSPLGNLRKLIASWVDMASGEERRGCLVTNTAVELAPHDPVVAGTVKAVLSRVERTFHRTLKRAVDAGELREDTNTRALARFLTNSVQGVGVMSKASVSRATIKDITNVTLSLLE